MGAEWRRGQMSAWLLKKKSGSSMVRMRQYNKRYFTIDFDSHVFFYSHAEGSKKVSSVIRFVDILDVRMPDAHFQTPADGKGSMIRRSFSFGQGPAAGAAGGSEEKAHHFVIVDTRSAKTLELLCASANEASQWFQAFKEAMVFCRDDGPAADIGGNGSGVDEMDAGPLSPSAGSAAVATGAHAVQLAPPAGTGVDHCVGPSSPSAGGGTGGYPTAAAARPPTTAPDTPPVLAGVLATGSTAEVVEPMVKAGATSGAEKAAPPTEVASAPPAEAASALHVEERTSEAPASASGPSPVAEPVQAPALTPTRAPPLVAEEQPGAEDGGEQPPPPVRGTFLDLSTELESEEPLGLGEPGSGLAAASVATGAGGGQTVVVETGGMMQASDFGFAADDDTESSGSAVSTPREAPPGELAPSLGAASVGVEPASGVAPRGVSVTGKGAANSAPVVADAGAPISAPFGIDDSPDVGHRRDRPAEQRPSSSYADQHQGLSMQERLANLEFSDCEDEDDDDPLGLGIGKAKG